MEIISELEDSNLKIETVEHLQIVLREHSVESCERFLWFHWGVDVLVGWSILGVSQKRHDRGHTECCSFGECFKRGRF